MAGIFQVYAIEGRSIGTKDGLLLNLEDGKKLIFDGEFAGFDAADAQYKKLIDDAIKEGFCTKPKIAGN